MTDGITRVLLLCAPSANRVYTAAAGPLLEREAERVLTAHLGTPATASARTLAGVEYLEIRANAPRAEVARIASTLSAVLGLFALEDDSGDEHTGNEALPLLRPVPLVDPHRWGSELETTLKYSGKTNEQFTALLLNLAAAASDRREGLLDGSLAVLDPMCGRGTTLSRALRLGLSPVGADIDSGDLEAYRAFLLTWMRSERLKHTSSSGRLTVAGRRLGTRFEAEFARDKAAQKAGETQHVTLLGCDTTAVGDVLAARSVDALVADLPYGVQHGSRSGGALQRSPLEVLRRAAPVWRDLLRATGGMALALNRHTCPYEEAASVLTDAGFTVHSRDGEFRHRVDQSIDRDVLLAVRSDHPRPPARADDPR